MTSTLASSVSLPRAAAPMDISLAVAAGRNLIAAGSIFAVANAVQWAIMSGALDLHPAVLSLTWPIAVGTFLVILRQLRAAGGEAGRRTAAWSRVAILSQIGAALVLVAASAATGQWGLMMWTSVVGLALYAIAWGIAAVRTRRAWIGGVALGCLCAAGGVATLVGTPSQYLAYACGLLVFAFMPGLVLVFRGRI